MLYFDISMFLLIFYVFIHTIGIDTEPWPIPSPSSTRFELQIGAMEYALCRPNEDASQSGIETAIMRWKLPVLSTMKQPQCYHGSLCCPKCPWQYVFVPFLKHEIVGLYSKCFIIICFSVSCFLEVISVVIQNSLSLLKNNKSMFDNITYKVCMCWVFCPVFRAMLQSTSYWVSS